MSVLLVEVVHGSHLTSVQVIMFLLAGHMVGKHCFFTTVLQRICRYNNTFMEAIK